MSSSSSQYTSVALYSLYQASQSGSASSNAAANSSVSAKNLANLGTALQSGNLSNAQSTLATLQDGLTGDADTTNPNSSANATSSTDSDSDSSTDDSSDQTDPSGPFTNNSAANSDYQSMVLNLGSGNIAKAAKDYTQLQTDLKLHSGGHHHRGDAAVPVQTIDTNSTADDTAGSVINVTV